MTREEANALHNPFIRSGHFRADVQIDCTECDPDPSLLNNSAVALIFPSQAWIDVAASVPTITALFIDRPKAKDLNSLANLSLINLTVSYPSRVKDWTFLQRIPSLLRLSLHNTLSLPDLEAVRSLPCLEVFQLSGGYSSSLRLPSLSPLADCRRLTAIDLVAIRCTDWSLKPLFGLSALRRFDCPLWWPSTELHAFLAHNKVLQCNVTERT